MKLGNRTLLGGFLVVAALFLVNSEASQTALAAQQKGFGKGQQGGPSSKSDPKYLAVFRDSVAKASRSTLRILCDGVDTALGVVVTPDGFILTKASDLKGTITVKLHNGDVLEAKWVGHEQAHDLAMLKIDAINLPPIEFTDSAVAPVGNFVASVGTGTDPVAVGVISVAARKMPAVKEFKAPSPTAGFLGVVTIDDPRGAKVSELAKGGFGGGKGGKGGPGGGKGGPGGPGGGKGGGNPNVASKIKAGDIIVALGDKAIVNSATLVKELQRYKAGQEVSLKLLRGDEELEFKIRLNTAPPNRADTQNNMGSKLSDRRTGFPVILQHDSVVLPTDCGGPICDLEGHVVGLNIAGARVAWKVTPSRPK